MTLRGSGSTTLVGRAAAQGSHQSTSFSTLPGSRPKSHQPATDKRKVWGLDGLVGRIE